jgi:UDP-GlcNAc:undecaprenyl-phosphate GlcNAc-1-phosphate transferase
LNYKVTFAVLFASALLLAYLLSPVAARLGERVGMVDVPGGRRRHAGRIPRTGGIAIFLGFTIPAALLFVIPEAWLPPRFDPKEPIRLLGLLVVGTIIFAAGLADDRFDLSPKTQLAIQVAVGVLSVPFLIIIQRVNNPITNRQVVFPWSVVIVLTVFWIVGMINTVNFLDGLDGLATGVGAILCAILTIHMLRQGQTSVAIVTLIMLGATLGFLPHNFHPARVFLGSNGSYYLGYSLGALGIIAGAKVATVLAVMSLPILDVAWLIWRRWRAKRSPMSADRWHLHYRLLDMGFSQRQIVLAYYLYSAMAGALALGISTRLYKLIALLILGAMVSFAILWAEKAQK